METLAAVLLYEMFFLLAALAGIIGYRMLTRRINTRGLLCDKDHPRRISPGRLQMLIVTMLVAVYFVARVAESGRMPELPQGSLMALGGSHLVYLAGKLYGTLAGKLWPAANRPAGGPK